MVGLTFPHVWSWGFVVSLCKAYDSFIGLIVFGDFPLTTLVMAYECVITNMYYSVQFNVGSRDLNSDPHSYMTQALSNVHLSSLRTIFLRKASNLA